MIFDELRNMKKISIPVAAKASLEMIGTEVLPSGKKYELEVDEDYLKTDNPDMIHYILQGNVIKMLSRRKLNEEGLGKYLIYHPHKNRTLKLTDIINQTL